jgi:hypothetical protein
MDIVVGIFLYYLGFPLLIIPCLAIHWYLVFAHQASPLEFKTSNRSHLQHDITNSTIKRWQWLAFINKQILFPSLITLYLILLLIGQTTLRNLQISSIYLAIDQNFLLFLVIISGLGTVYENETLFDHYVSKQSSLLYHWLYIALVAGLSLLGTYIIGAQVNELGIIWSIIATLAGILIFLVGIMLLEEDNEQLD